MGIIIDNFLDLALKGKNNLWRYIVGIVIILTVFYGYFAFIPDNVAELGQLGNYILQDFSFVLFLITTLLVVRYLHKRPFKSLITPRKSINWKLIGVGLVLFTVLLFLFTFLPQYLFEPSSITLNPNIYGFLIFLPVLLVMVPIQTTAEELFYRGYLLQGMGFLTRNFLLLAIINGILFMIPHLANPEVAASPLMAIIDYTIFGFFLAYITLKSNTIELAIAGHASNNLFIAILANSEISVSPTPSLFLSSSATNSDIVLLFSLAASVLIPLLYYVIMFKVKWFKRFMRLETNEL